MGVRDRRSDTVRRRETGEPGKDRETAGGVMGSGERDGACGRRGIGRISDCVYGIVLTP